MGNPQPGAAIDACLHQGGWVVTASDRAARALQLAFHQRRRDEGLQAWPTPAILDWSGFIRHLWRERIADDRLLLNPVQETALWTDILTHEQHILTLLVPSRVRLARLASQAHDLLCSYAPQFLPESTRRTWDNDSAAFSRWLAAFDSACRREKLLSPSRAPLELIQSLQSDSTARPTLLAAGFDRILPIQRTLFDASGPWQPLSLPDHTSQPRFFSARDQQSELAACARWCSMQVATRPDARIIVIAHDVASRRGEIERAFVRCAEPIAPSAFEFSLGVPLSTIDIVRAASSLLRWLRGSLSESEIDWFFSTSAQDPAESIALQTYMRALRQRGLARPDWTLEAFIQQNAGAHEPPTPWLQRITEGRKLLASVTTRDQSPLDWSALVPRLLVAAGIPGARALTSAEFQAWSRFQQALDSCASLGFDGRRLSWSDFLQSFQRILDETLYAPESVDAPIQISGPAETAGLASDAIWFLGADEDSWPAAGSTNPLLPFSLQRDHRMPHASAQLDFDLALAMSQRFIASASTVHFSYARLRGNTEARPSRIALQVASSLEPLPDEWSVPNASTPIAISFDDFTAIPFPAGRILGGSSVLTAQTQCAFKAFATARLGAAPWDPAEAGLTAMQRGQILHDVLHAVWANDPPRGIRSLTDLRAIPDLESFVTRHVQFTLQAKIPAGVRARMPQRYLDLEGLRLTRLITEWLRYESTRLPFAAEATESMRPINIEGLSLDLRLDRLDRLADGSLLVLDYKTGDVSPKEWQLPRPNDVQLPLYATYGLEEEPAGLLFAKIRTGDLEFTGHIRDARATLKTDLHPQSALVKQRLTREQFLAWKLTIEQLARDFLAGRADVNPRDYPKTCEHCGLQSVCRVAENISESEEEIEERGDD
jgi:ATP-dependent helicase/nuclease subunit B